MDEPIAILGMACRFPRAPGLDAFWALLRDGVDAITEVPADRWDIDALYDPNPRAPGKMSTRWGGFLSDVDTFDPGFFGISPREAAQIDPQQRLALELSWESLEDAGIPPGRLRDSRTGVFFGAMWMDYSRLSAGAAEHIVQHTVTGQDLSIVPARVSYTLGLTGPSLAVNTAASSSLVALHLACQSLSRGESRLALAGGFNLLLSPESTIAMTKFGAMAPDGRSKAFDARANGYVRGEGGGVVVLKRLSDALADGDHIDAVIRGSAVNNDGFTNGLTAPSPRAQQAVLRDACAAAGVAAHDVQYVEAHGTGTMLGDPIEASALGAVLGAGRPAERSLRIGSVKTNIGHLEAAAGIAGLIKVVLSMRHRMVPPSLHFERPNPQIDFDRLRLRVQTTLAPWEGEGDRLIAGVSSFGFGGTNCHVIVESAPRTKPRDASQAGERAEEPRAQLVLLSAKSAAAVAAQAARLRDHLRRNPEQTLGDVAFSLATTRSPLDHRLSLVATTGAALEEALDTAALGASPVGSARGEVRGGAAPKVVFVFPGQGSQWLGMGRQLLRDEAAFREALERCERAIQAEAGFSILGELAADEGSSRMDRIDVVQPVLFAIEVGLAALWRSWGVVPDAVVGHSMGEAAAAYVAGALSLEDAAAIICRRSRLLARISGQGEMAMVDLSFAEAEAAVRGSEDRLSVAVNNGPRSSVLAGEPAALHKVVAELEAAGVFCRRVKVDVASHSPQVDPLRGDLLAALASLRPQQASVPMRSTVTGEPVVGTELSASYWAENLRRPVRFGDAVQALLDTGHTLFIEMSPHPILSPSVQSAIQTSAHCRGAAVGSLRRGHDDRSALLESLGALWTQGLDLAWERLFPPGSRRVRLPTYAWQRERHWLDLPAAGARPAGRSRADGHPLLGEPQRIATRTGARVWETTLDLERLPWLRDCRVGEAVVLPAAVYVEMALAAFADCFEPPCSLTELTFTEALSLSEGHPIAVQVVVEDEPEDRARFQIASLTGEKGALRIHARGTMTRGGAPGEIGPRSPEALCPQLGEPLLADAVYPALGQMGLDYGPAFRGVEALWRRGTLAVGRVRVPRAAPSAPAFKLAPGLLEACFQVMIGAFCGEDAAPWVPAALSSVRVGRRALGELWCEARLAGGASLPPDRRRGDLVLTDEAGEVIVEVTGLEVQRLANTSRRREGDDWFVAIDWERAPPSAPVDHPRRFLLLGGADTVGGALRTALRRGGHTVVHAVDVALESAPSGCWPINDNGPADICAVLTDAFGARAPDAVVCLGGIEARSLDAASMDLVLDNGITTVLSTVQALSRMGYRNPPRLWIVTRGAQVVGEREVMVAQAPLLGLGRVVSTEHPELRCAQVDVDPASDEGSVRSLIDELLAPEAEDEVALRGKDRYVARVVRRPPEPGARPSGSSVRADGAYLITGGLGGLGLHIARWLAEQGAGTLVLVDRTTSLTPAQEAAISAMGALGAKVHVAKADVAERAELAAVLGSLDAAGPPLRGVIHAAGEDDDGPLNQLTPARFRAVMAPKVLGALHLDELTREAPLSFFVLCASISGLLGSPGQGLHAAAGTFLDALAHRRRTDGRPSLSIDWGPLSTVGPEAAHHDEAARLAAQGVACLTPEQAMRALARAMHGEGAQVGVAPLDAGRWVASHPATASSRRLSALLATESARAPFAGAIPLVRRLDGVERASERVTLVRAAVRAEASRVLRIPEDKLALDAPLTGLGMDSLMGLELRNRIEAGLGLRLSPTLICQYPTIAHLADYLVEKHLLAVVTSGAKSPTTEPLELPGSTADDYEEGTL